MLYCFSVRPEASGLNSIQVLITAMIENASRLQPGIDIEASVHWTSAQSPVPLIAIAITSRMGKTSSIYSNPGPQAGTLSSGRLCSHSWRDAIAAPPIAMSPVIAAYTFCPSRAGLCIAARIQNTAMSAKTARCIIHIGHGFMLLNGSM